MKKIFSAFMIAICCLAMAMPAQAQLIKFGHYCPKKFSQT